MPVKTVDELMTSLNNILGDRDDDDALEFIQDMNDTVSDLSSHSGYYSKQQYDELDAKWRKRYRDRFFSAAGAKDEQHSDDDGQDEDDNDSATTVTIRDLFTKK